MIDTNNPTSIERFFELSNARFYSDALDLQASDENYEASKRELDISLVKCSNTLRQFKHVCAKPCIFVFFDKIVAIFQLFKGNLILLKTHAISRLLLTNSLEHKFSYFKFSALSFAAISVVALTCLLIKRSSISPSRSVSYDL